MVTAILKILLTLTGLQTVCLTFSFLAVLALVGFLGYLLIRPWHWE